MSIVTTVLYFVTSSDSGSLVVDLIAANGREAHVSQRVFWAVTEGAVAIATVASGGFDSLSGLQAVSIVMGLPFTFILMIMCTSLWRALKIEAGDMPNINKRTDWTLPLYGGIFDLPEVLLTCGRCPLPSRKSIIDFLGALVVPGYVLYQAMTGLSKHQKEPLTFWARAILGAVTQFLFMGSSVSRLLRQRTGGWWIKMSLGMACGLSLGSATFPWPVSLPLVVIRFAVPTPSKGLAWRTFGHHCCSIHKPWPRWCPRLPAIQLPEAKAVEDSAFDGL